LFIVFGHILQKYQKLCIVLLFAYGWG